MTGDEAIEAAALVEALRDIGDVIDEVRVHGRSLMIGAYEEHGESGGTTHAEIVVEGKELPLKVLGTIKGSMEARLRQLGVTEGEG